MKVQSKNIFQKLPKIPCVSPILHDHKFMTDFSEKAELFNFLFAKQCSLITNTNKFTNCETLTDKSITNFSFIYYDIGETIKVLDTNKAHGHDMINIRLLNICKDSIYKPLCLNFHFMVFLDQGT